MNKKVLLLSTMSLLTLASCNGSKVSEEQFLKARDNILHHVSIADPLPVFSSYYVLINMNYYTSDKDSIVANTNYDYNHLYYRRDVNNIATVSSDEISTNSTESYYFDEDANDLYSIIEYKDENNKTTKLKKKIAERKSDAQRIVSNKLAVDLVNQIYGYESLTRISESINDHKTLSRWIEENKTEADAQGLHDKLDFYVKTNSSISYDWSRKYGKNLSSTNYIIEYAEQSIWTDYIMKTYNETTRFYDTNGTLKTSKSIDYGSIVNEATILPINLTDYTNCSYDVTLTSSTTELERPFTIWPSKKEYKNTLVKLGAELPTAITIKVGENTITQGSDYTYDNSTGDITINTGVITGNVEIIA